MRLTIDAIECVGHGRCYAEFPELFKDDEQGHGLVRGDAHDSEQAVDWTLAASRCPEGAIELLDN